MNYLQIEKTVDEIKFLKECLAGLRKSQEARTLLIVSKNGTMADYLKLPETSYEDLRLWIDQQIDVLERQMEALIQSIK